MFMILCLIFSLSGKVVIDNVSLCLCSCTDHQCPAFPVCNISSLFQFYEQPYLLQMFVCACSHFKSHCEVRLKLFSAF